MTFMEMHVKWSVILEDLLGPEIAHWKDYVPNRVFPRLQSSANRTHARMSSLLCCSRTPRYSIDYLVELRLKQTL